ncbi:rhomboid family intramembrane serine protease [Rhodococcus artemisiae]|uniref:Rhomboid family intramembrane serine protease n=1 Tax=Rhodococcus artemisiae TaxID=714159 RepID=A0ABU7LIQ1_9NOCA|nr:rhomboid family intramembrane serine protease [Rhodococcus artemisiae]MEE2061124.1 rhomboid family intramembrane serine protease [Rhodococcus artemisiae]
MSTSGDDPRSWVLYAVVVALTALMAAPGRSVAKGWWWPPPVAAIALWVLVAVPSVIRLISPSLLDVFRRYPVRTRDGEWWRVLTSALTQDGGVAGTVGNLVMFAIVAIAAVRVWGWQRAVALFAVGQVLWGLFTSFVAPSVGAGVSGATFVMAASLAGLWPVVGARRTLLVASAGTFVAGALLVVLDDAHGVAVLIGMLLGAVLGIVLPPSRQVAASGPEVHGGLRS